MSIIETFSALFAATEPKLTETETENGFDNAAWSNFVAPTAVTDSIRAKQVEVKRSEKRATSGAPRTQEPGGLAGYTPRWNALAVEAIALGIPGVKLHRVETRPGEANTFATYSIARARVAWLEAKIAAAKKVAE
jgi:hypothetical protein